jgi:hypothetical protein
MSVPSLGIVRLDAADDLEQLGGAARRIRRHVHEGARVRQALVHGGRREARARERQHARRVVRAALEDKALELAIGVYRVVRQQRQPRVLRGGDAVARGVELLARARAVRELQQQRTGRGRIKQRGHWCGILGCVQSCVCGRRGAHARRLFITLCGATAESTQARQNLVCNYKRTLQTETR